MVKVSVAKNRNKHDKEKRKNPTIAESTSIVRALNIIGRNETAEKSLRTIVFRNSHHINICFHYDVGDSKLSCPSLDARRNGHREYGCGPVKTSYHGSV